MELINFKVEQQKIVCDRKSLVSKTQGEYKCKFTFDETWNGLTKSAVFLKGESKIKILLDANNECSFADELLTDRGNLYVGVCGANASIIKPTIKTDLMVILEGVMGGDDPTPPTPSEYQQIISNYNTAIANFNNEVTRATTKETQLNTKIETETTRATTKENSIESKVNAEETRAKAKEDEIASSVSTEETRAKAKEDEILASVSAEETRAKAKENEIIANIPTKVSELTNDTGYVTNAYHDSSKQDVINDLSSIRSGAQAGATAVQPSSLDGYYSKTQVDELLKDVLILNVKGGN